MDIIKEPKKGIRKKHLPWIIGGGALLAFVFWLALVPHTRTLTVNRRTLVTAAVKNELFNDYVHLEGQVQPISIVQIAPEEGGIVQEKVKEEGTTVKKGDVILRLKNANLDVQILNAEAELAEKQNQLRNTQVTMQQNRLSNENERLQLDVDIQRKRRVYEQNKRLYREELISREEFLQAEEDFQLACRKHALVNERLRQDSIYRTLQMEQMEDNLTNMQRNVLLIRERKNKLEIKSPIDGELGQLNVELGQNISSGSMIGQVNDLSDNKVTAYIDETYIERVHKGQEALFRRDTTDYRLIVQKVYPEVRSGRFRADFVFEGTRPAQIRSGQTYYIDLQLSQPTHSLQIPKGSFFQVTGGRWIFVLSPDGTAAHRREIRINRQNPQNFEVTEGLNEGETVILNGYERFKDFDELNIRQ